MPTSSPPPCSLRDEYDRLGLQPIPLSPNQKKPIPGHSWKRPDIWQYAHEQSNIGLICGGKSQLLVIDCDEKECPGTYQRIQEYLQSLKIEDYPTIQTASGLGRHIYLQSMDAPKGSFYVLSQEFGNGEIRYGDGSYVVAPPSLVDKEKQYCLIAGDLAHRPFISWRDIRPLLLSFNTNGDDENPLFEKLNRNARSILFGKIPARYPSRSEAEQSFILTCINKGLEYEEIVSLFVNYPVGGKFKEKYLQNPQRGLAYLEHSYQSAKQQSETHISEGREKAIYAINWAKNRAWEGRTGSHDRAVFLAHAQIAHDSGKLEFQASVRELAQRSGKCISSVSNANTRLIKKGFIEKVRESTCSLAYTYRIGQTCTLPQYNTVRECTSLSSHDAFRRGGLGKSGLQIWEALQDEPKSITELIEYTGKCRRTIKRKVERMQNIIDMRTGEIISMLEFDGERYSSLKNIDLDHIARLLGTHGEGARQKARHEIERMEHKAVLERNLTDFDAKH